MEGGQGQQHCVLSGGIAFSSSARPISYFLIWECNLAFGLLWPLTVPYRGLVPLESCAGILGLRPPGFWISWKLRGSEVMFSLLSGPRVVLLLHLHLDRIWSLTCWEHWDEPHSLPGSWDEPLSQCDSNHWVGRSFRGFVFVWQVAWARLHIEESG